MGFHGMTWDIVGNYRTFMGQSTGFNKKTGICAPLHGTAQHLVMGFMETAIGSKMKSPLPLAGEGQGGGNFCKSLVIILTASNYLC